jgi:hypothetical protein
LVEREEAHRVVGFNLQIEMVTGLRRSDPTALAVRHNAFVIRNANRFEILTRAAARARA